MLDKKKTEKAIKYSLLKFPQIIMAREKQQAYQDLTQYHFSRTETGKSSQSR